LQLGHSEWVTVSFHLFYKVNWYHFSVRYQRFKAKFVAKSVVATTGYRKATTLENFKLCTAAAASTGMHTVIIIVRCLHKLILDITK
jgi:hypothetical protein